MLPRLLPPLLLLALFHPGFALSAAPALLDPGPWPTCPTQLMERCRHRVCGPPSLIPSWWTRAVVERVRACLDCDVVQLAGVPTLITFKSEGTRARAILLEPLDGSPRREVKLGARGLARESTHGRPSAAVLGDTLAVVQEFGSEYIAYLVDARRGALSRSWRVELPALTRDGMNGSHRPALAAGPDRFGMALGHSDELVWLEFDAKGRIRASPRVLSRDMHEEAPQVVWDGTHFVAKVRSTRGRGMDSRRVPELWRVSPDGTGLERFASFMGPAVEPTEGAWTKLTGRLVFEQGAYFLSARFAPRGHQPENRKFSVLRATRTGEVARRDCPDIDEE